MCIGANLNHSQDEEFTSAVKLVREYKAIRAMVQQGNLYRLVSPCSRQRTARSSMPSIGPRSMLEESTTAGLASVECRGGLPGACGLVHPMLRLNARRVARRGQAKSAGVFA